MRNQYLIFIFMICVAHTTIVDCSLFYDAVDIPSRVFSDLIDFVADGLTAASDPSNYTCSTTDCFSLRNNKYYRIIAQDPVPLPDANTSDRVQRFFFNVPGGHWRGKVRPVHLSLIYISCSPSLVCMALPSFGFQISVMYHHNSHATLLLNRTISSVSQEMFTFESHVSYNHSITLVYPASYDQNLQLTYIIGLSWLETPPAWAIFLAAVVALLIILVLAVLFLLFKRFIKTRILKRKKSVVRREFE